MILPDLARRCPAVDPDEHRLFVSLGCAAENLIQAAHAHGFAALASLDGARNAMRTALEPAPARATPLFRAIPQRQSTRAEYAGQVRSSAGIAVFVGPADDQAGRIAVGRSFESFALQATALGVRTVHLNQPVEVAAMRPSFADFLGVGGRRPDLVVRHGRGPTLPPSLRPPLQAVLV